MFNKLSDTKRSIMIVKLISTIIISILKIRSIYKNISDSILIEKFNFLKDISSLTYDILTLNILSIICNGIPIFSKLKKFTENIKKRFKKMSDDIV